MEFEKTDSGVKSKGFLSLVVLEVTAGKFTSAGNSAGYRRKDYYC
jgi:hypothetical protein